MTWTRLDFDPNVDYYKALGLTEDLIKMLSAFPLLFYFSTMVLAGVFRGWRDSISRAGPRFRLSCLP